MSGVDGVGVKKEHSVSGLASGLFYAGLIGAGVLLFVLIRQYGETLTPPGGAGVVAAKSAAAAQGTTLHPLVHVLIALAAVILLGRILARLFRYIHQPPVIGEVTAGLLLGPSFLGMISPDAMQFVMPPVVSPYLGVLSQLGVILYMFIVGLELNASRLKSQMSTALIISHASIVVPFVLGAVVALPLYTHYSGGGIRFTAFSLFLGVAMSITAFPVLARILTDQQLHATSLGTVALAAAAFDDATAWCLLAFVVGVTQAQVDQAVWVAIGTAIYLAVMLIVARPLIQKWTERQDQMALKTSENPLTQERAAWMLIGLLISALTTEFIGIHAIFGAFVLGAIIPHDSAVARSFTEKFQDLILVLFLPAFFAHVGMRTQLGLVSSPQEWQVCAGIILVATIGKFGGTWVAARWVGHTPNEASALGLLMNTRGLMELVVLNIGLDLGVLSPKLFVMMVLMAVFTTVITSPLLARFERTTFGAVQS